MASAPKMKPSAGGAIQNAKAQGSTKQFYGKASAKAATKYPSKKPGMSNDNASKRKPSPLARKGK